MTTHATQDSIRVGKHLRELRSLEINVINAYNNAGSGAPPAAYLDGLVEKLRKAQIAYDAALERTFDAKPTR